MQAAGRKVLVCLHNSIYWMYSKVVMQHLHTVPTASSNLATSTIQHAPVDKLGKVASLKQRSIICQFESDQGYQIV